jgi:4-amino-4-deoxy-L-arabinose transferase-like glycosyltransferase
LQIPATPRAGFAALLFAFVVFHCFFTGLDKVGLVGPDEPRYASIARAMARSGDWVTPRLNGAPWFEKPPLYYWSAAIGFRLFSSPEVASRAPSGLFALCAVLATALLALRIYGETTARAIAWMLPATVGMIGFARAAATDMPFAACLALAMCAAARLVLEEQPAHEMAWAAAFGVALGLAVLAKGPAAILLAGGSTALWAFTRKELRRSLRLFHPLAIGSFLLVALPWYALCAMRNPDFLRVFLMEHNVERFLTNRYQHPQPFWFFLPILLLAVFPWTLLLIPAASDGWRALRNSEWRKSPSAYFAAWVLFPFLFFSASQSKLPGYILPAVPPLVLLLARALAGGKENTAPFPRSRILLIAAALVAGGGVAVLRSGANLPAMEAQQPLRLAGIALACGGGVVAATSAWRGLQRSAAAAAVVVSFIAGLAANHVLPALDPQISARAVARRAQGMEFVGTFHLARAWRYGCDFYMGAAVPELSPDTPSIQWVITDDAGRSQLASVGWNLERMEPRSGRAALYRVKNVQPIGE